VLMFRDQSLRHHMYSFCVDWTGGIYATPTLTGSRAGSVVAACWASMMHYGENGYVESTRKIVAATRRIAKGITDEFDQIDVVGVPDASVVAFGASKSSKVNIYSVADVMKDRFGWELATLQNPPSVHLALTLPTAKNADLFLSNLKHSVGTVLQDPKKYSKGTAGIYGMAASLPTQLIEESVKVYLDVCSGTISTSSSSK
jgi:sphinganine-1-phosphate aldolase